MPKKISVKLVPVSDQNYWKARVTQLPDAAAAAIGVNCRAFSEESDRVFNCSD